MTPDDGQDSQPDHRTTRDVPGDAITLRQPDDEDGTFEVEMPIATTGEVRNEGDDPLTREELDGMARQIDERAVPVFLDHGSTDLGGRARYAAVEKIGEWQGGDVRERDEGADELVATARLMDPDTLPDLGGLREAVGAIREQVKRDFSLSASIGWRDDEDYPGGVDFMEASIVGIGADPRTTSDAEAVALARAATVASEADDPDAVVDRFREVTHDMTDDESTESDTEADTEQDEQPDESRDQDLLERLVDLQEQQMDTLESIEQSVRQEDEDDDEEDDDTEENETDEDDEDEDDENAADEPDDEQALREEVADLRKQLSDLREGGLDADDVDTPDADEEQNADDGESTTDDASDPNDWRAHT